MRATWRTATLTVAIAYTACTSSHPAPIDGADRVLSVAQPGGATDTVHVYVATPPGAGPFPVVVYGHGQGAGNVVNCTPEDGDVVTSKHIADALAREGYLAIAVFYRNRGTGIPTTGELRPRDHYILDARAFLAAAQLGRELGGDARVAFIGVSMGSFPATWATAPLPELADLQAGLDIVTAIPTAMLGNHLGNTGRNQDLLASSDLAVRASSIAFASFAAVTAPAALALQTSTSGALDSPLLTPAGRVLFERVFVDAGCGAQVPAVCSTSCFMSTFEAVAQEHGITRVDAQDWLTAEALEAIAYWDPPSRIDPGAPTTNRMLAAQRALSPAYALSGPLKTRRLLPLTSTGDHVVTDQLAGGNQPAELYLARLRATGVTIPDPVPVVRDGTCGHGDYLDPSRPQCGWSLVLAELDAAF